MGGLYNEIDPFAAQWLRNLSAAGHIAPGVVDERSIKDLAADDVAGPGQRHFFAGIAGWSLALRLAGVADDAGVWTGSCPCQPFSDAGRGRGVADDRHLWPDWFRLIRECRPGLVFGEQVASAAGLAWLDAVHADMEGAGYTIRAADLCAASVGAPHRRQRLFFVAYADEAGRSILGGVRLSGLDNPPRRDDADGCSEAVGMAHANGGGWHSGTRDVPSRGEQPDAARSGAPRDCACWDPGCGHRKHGYPLVAGQRWADGSVVTLADAEDERRRSRWFCGPHGRPTIELVRHGNDGGLADPESSGRSEGLDGGQTGPYRGAGSSDGGWEGCDWIPCSDGVSRPVEPRAHPLAHGVPARVGKLRAYGNAIVPQVAAAFIRAALEAG